MRHRVRGYKKKLRIYWHLKTGRYQSQRVATPSELEACNDVLSQVRTTELNRSGELYHGAKLAAHPDHEQDGVISCVDTHTGRVVGAARFTRWTLIQADPTLAPDIQFPLDTFGALSDRAYVVQRMAISRDARGTGAGLHLLRSIYELSLQQGALICLIDCESQLWRQYARLGFRQQGQVYSVKGVLCVTMVLILHDRQHLLAVDSPLVSSLDSADVPIDEAAQGWWNEVGQRRSQAKNFEMVDPSTLHQTAILHGLSARGRQQFLRHSTRVFVPPNLPVFRRGDGAVWMCMVESGSLETFMHGQNVATDGPGSVVGELAYLTHGARSADVFAGPHGATIVTLSPRAPTRVTSPKDRAQLWENMSRGLASRFIAGDAELPAHVGSSPAPRSRATSPPSS